MKPLNKIMVLDDDEVNNFIFSKLITISGFANEVVTVENAESALNYLKENAQRPASLPEVLFIDLFLYRTTGWEFLEQFEKLDKSIRDRIYVVILTSSLYDDDRKKASNYASVKKFISKPVTVENLEKIRNEIGNKLSFHFF